jgi:hypothetical protein
MSHNWHSYVSHACADPPYSGPMESTRHNWNDERMDEFANRTEENFRGVGGEIRDTGTELRKEIHETGTELRKEIHDTGTELRKEIHEGDSGLKGEINLLRVEMNGRFAGLERRFDILFGALATGFVAAVVQHFLG